MADVAFHTIPAGRHPWPAGRGGSGWAGMLGVEAVVGAGEGGLRGQGRVV